MATATAAITVVDSWDDGKRIHAFGSLDFDTGDYVTGGVPVSFTNLYGGQRVETVEVVSLHGKAGYFYDWDRANKKVIIRQCAGAGSPASQIAQAQLPAAVSSDVIDFHAICKKFQ